MKTHFSKLRRLTTLSSVAGPMLLFVTFLCVARGWTPWAAIPAAFAIFLLCAFPCEIVAENRPDESDGKLGRWISLLGTIMFVIWITSLPEFVPFIERVYSSEALWDWRLIAAVFMWSGHWSYSNYRKARSLGDRDIINIYDENLP